MARFARYLVFGLILGMLVWLSARAYYTSSFRPPDMPTGEQEAWYTTQKKLGLAQDTLQQDYKVAKEQLTTLQHGKQVNQTTIAELQKNLLKLNKTLYTLRHEVEFYENMMDETGNGSGFSIQGLLLSPSTIPHHYEYKLVLIHMEKSNRFVEGTIEWVVRGEQDGDGEQETLRLKDLHLDEDSSLDFKFKRFKQMQGRIGLPAAFQPDRIKVRVRIQGQRKPVERDFPWPYNEDEKPRSPDDIPQEKET